MFRSTILALLLISTASAQVGGILANKSNGLPPRNKIGMNIGGVSDFDTYWVFSDLIRNAVWITHSDNRISNDITLSTSDQVAGSFGLVRLQAVDTSVQYELRIRKKSNYALPGVATVSIKFDTYDFGMSQNSNITTQYTADTTITIPQAHIDYITADPNNVDLELPHDIGCTVSIDSIDADTYIELWAPGTAPGVGEDPEDPAIKFHPKFVELLKHFGILRALNWVKINANNGNSAVIDDIADTLAPSFRSQADTRHGAALEHFLDLAEVCNADVWIPFNHAASNALIDHWCNILKTWKDAHPGRVVYIEYSNELWNAGFWQTHMSGTVEEAEPLYPYAMSTIGATLYPTDTATDQRTKASGRQAALFFNHVDTVLSPVDYVEVVSAQASVTSSPTKMLDEFALIRGAQPEAIAIAPYLTWRTSPNVQYGRYRIMRDLMLEFTGSESTKLGDLDEPTRAAVEARLVAEWPREKIVELILYDQNHGVKKSRDWIANHKAIADARGARLLFYENGQHIQADPSHAATFPLWADEYIAAQNDPRMLIMLQELYKAWYDVGGGDVGCYLTFIQKPRNGGSFDHLETMGFPVVAPATLNPDVNNPKWRAIMQLVKQRQFAPALAP